MNKIGNKNFEVLLGKTLNELPKVFPHNCGCKYLMGYFIKLSTHQMWPR